MHKKRLQRLTAVVLAVIMMLSLAAVAGAENTEDIVREADVSVPDEGNVLVALRGSAAVKSEKQALLNTLNALRKEACDKGYPNPENPSVALTSEDYVPLEWNADLEEMAQLRSAEGIVEGSDEPVANLAADDDIHIATAVVFFIELPHDVEVEAVGILGVGIASQRMVGTEEGAIVKPPSHLRRLLTQRQKFLTAFVLEDLQVSLQYLSRNHLVAILLVIFHQKA